MKYVLVIVQDPQAQGVDTQALRTFASNVLAESSGIPQEAMLNPGALPLEHGLSGLSRLVSEAAEKRLRLHSLFFDQKPAWVLTVP